MNLEEFYQGPLVVDIAIAFITLETLLLWALHKISGRVSLRRGRALRRLKKAPYLASRPG